MQLLRCVITGITFIPTLACAQNAFNGTWRPDPQTFSPGRKVDVVVLDKGVYDCQTCAPPYKLKADGQDQPISGPYYDTLSVSIIDDRTVVKIAKKGGKTVVETKSIVSSDGKIKTDVQTMYDMAPRPIEMTSHSSRAAAGAAGSHAISGGWRMTDADVSNHAEDTIFKVSGDLLSMSDRMGRSFSAKLDGTEAPYNGSDEFDRVSLKLINEKTLQESDLKNGKVAKINLWTLSPDGTTIHARFDDTHGHIQEQDGHKVE